MCLFFPARTFAAAGNRQRRPQGLTSTVRSGSDWDASMIGHSTHPALFVVALAAACLALLGAEEVAAAATWYVDDDALSDPGHGDPSVSDPAEDGSEAHPFDAIQEGINAAVNGDTVVVLDGTYTGVGNRGLDFEGRAVTLTSSNGPNGCIIDCEAEAGGFVFNGGETQYTVVQGFTITRGNPGIACFFYSDPTIANNIITGNTAAGESGAGISCFYASPAITGNVITGNEAGVSGGGIYCRSDSLPTIVNNVIADNEAAGKGGGVAVHWTSSPLMANNTIAGNRASRGGGIYVIDLSLPTLVNSIVWGNTATTGPQIAIETDALAGSSLSVSYCDIAGGQPDAVVGTGATLVWGDGNFDSNPLFADADNGDYHLKSQSGRLTSEPGGGSTWVSDDVTSPCIDGGDPASDYSREPQPNLGRINIGAYGNTPEASKSKWTIPCDMNDDCVVNILDMILIRNNLNKDPGSEGRWKYDPNEDGNINILDMLFVRNSLGDRCE